MLDGVLKLGQKRIMVPIINLKCITPNPTVTYFDLGDIQKNGTLILNALSYARCDSEELFRHVWGLEL